MSNRTIARLYDNYDDASAVVSALEANGIPHSDVSIVANRPNGDTTTTTAGEPAAGAGAGAGATLGTLIGGGAGLLAGLGSLAIPGVGPVVAAGWLIATLTGAGVGAAAGGLLGSLTGAGVSEKEAHVYAEGVRRGGTLVSVRFDEARTAEVERVMAERRAVDWQQRETEYRSGGWQGFDDTTPPTGGAPVVGGMTTPGNATTGIPEPTTADIGGVRASRL